MVENCPQRTSKEEDASVLIARLLSLSEGEKAKVKEGLKDF